MTTKTYIVTFKDAENLGLKFTTYPIRVKAVDLDEAQEKAIDIMEEASIKHGSILSITRSLSTL